MQRDRERDVAKLASVHIRWVIRMSGTISSASLNDAIAFALPNFTFVATLLGQHIGIYICIYIYIMTCKYVNQNQQ